jgi:hypothetical protein
MDEKEMLTSLFQMIPNNVEDKFAYLQKSLNILNTSDQVNVVGKRISPALSNAIISNRDVNCNPTKAVFFSIAKIMESISKISNSDLPNAGLAVIFGKYPENYSADFETAGIELNIFNLEYKSKNTVVLKYINDINNINNSNFIKDVFNNELIDNLGKLCPNNCPNGI